MRRAGNNFVGSVAEATPDAIADCAADGGIASFEFAGSGDNRTVCKNGKRCYYHGEVGTTCSTDCTAAEVWDDEKGTCVFLDVATTVCNATPGHIWDNAKKQCVIGSAPFPGGGGGGLGGLAGGLAGLGAGLDAGIIAAAIAKEKAICDGKGGHIVKGKCIVTGNSQDSGSSGGGNTALIVGGLGVAGLLIYLATRKK